MQSRGRPSAVQRVSGRNGVLVGLVGLFACGGSFWRGVGHRPAGALPVARLSLSWRLRPSSDFSRDHERRLGGVSLRRRTTLRRAQGSACSREGSGGGARESLRGCAPAGGYGTARLSLTSGAARTRGLRCGSSARCQRAPDWASSSLRRLRTAHRGPNAGAPFVHVSMHTSWRFLTTCDRCGRSGWYSPRSAR
jgi:hypothetical protein